MSSHFKKKDALEHVIGKRAEGIASFAEPHGTEMPGYLSAATDAAREIALLLLMITTFSLFFTFPIFPILLSFSLAWCAWKTGRSAWLSWSRLERLHRLIEQEKYEIEHHRAQERAELAAIYKLKGFEGKLLEDVIDILMADQNRLLRVMLEEEFGLTLAAYEHPLKQAIGALVGTLVSALILGLSFLLFSYYGIVIASIVVIGGSACISAFAETNRLVSAIIWNVAIAGFAYGMFYFLLKIVL